MTTLIVIVVLALLLLYGIAVYNRLVRLRALVGEAFSGITVQLRRRADLIPNLVETVKGYAAHERETLEAVTAQRSLHTPSASAGVAETAAADQAMTGMIGRLMAVAENYPELQADDNFRQLQTDLTATEEQLQGARRYYNAAARDLNTRVQSFPDLIFAGPLGFRTVDYYEDDDASIQKAPQVGFGKA